MVQKPFWKTKENSGVFKHNWSYRKLLFFILQAMKDAVKYGQADEPPLLEGEKVQESTCKYWTAVKFWSYCLLFGWIVKQLLPMNW